MASFKFDRDHVPFFLLVFVVTVLFLILPFTSVFAFTPKIIAIAVIALCATIIGKFRLLIKDWFIFVALVYFFDSLRGLVYIAICRYQRPVYTLYVIKLSQFLFKNIPAVWLQHALFKSHGAPQFSWVERALTVVHGSHFIVFLLVGFIIWQYRPKSFSLYRTSFLLLIGLGIAAYFVVPTVPPWLASDYFNVIPHLTRFVAEIYNLSIPDIFTGFDVNPVAAMPSLHAAFPVLLLLLLYRAYGRRALWFIPYVLLVVFTVIYSGEHYAVDIVAGAALAILSYIVAVRTDAWRKNRALRLAAEHGQLEGPSRSLQWPSVALGSGVILAALALGPGSQDRIKLDASGYDYYAPRYVDFFNHPEDYKENWQVQYYFGRHALSRGQFREALASFERAEALSADDGQKRATEAAIEATERLLSPPSH